MSFNGNIDYLVKMALNYLVKMTLNYLIKIAQNYGPNSKSPLVYPGYVAQAKVWLIPEKKFVFRPLS